MQWMILMGMQEREETERFHNALLPVWLWRGDLKSTSLSIHSDEFKEKITGEFLDPGVYAFIT